jgi:hypothetical protein
MRATMKWSAGALLGLAALVSSSGSALADEVAVAEIRVPTPTAASKTVPCPKSISSRYPGVVCRTSVTGGVEIAGPTGNADWENSGALPLTHPFVTGGGYFGDLRNQ